jgi:hypothetical protein
MLERSITEKEIDLAVETGTIIKEYPDDKPYPGYLALVFINNKPVHVVYAIENDDSGKNCFIITVYNPSPEEWESDFKTRRLK